MNSNDKKVTLKPIVTTVAADLLTPLAVYLSITDARTNAFLFESVEGNSSVARYSFIGAEPRFIAKSEGSDVEISEGSQIRSISPEIFTFLRDHFDSVTVDAYSGLPPLAGGAIGYIGFDCVASFEPTLRREEFSGSAELMFFDSVIAFDHVKQLIQIITLSGTGEFRTAAQAEKENARLKGILEAGAVRTPPSERRTVRAEIVSNFRKEEFENAVCEIKEMIAAGESYQVVLSQRFERATNASAVGIYRALRSLNPSPYMFILQIGGKVIIGSSPEMLVRSFGKRLEYRPIAGTRPRGDTDLEDDRLAAEMLADPKEIAEHMMLVDLGRNDLGRVAEFGSVTVEQLMGVEKYSHVQHIVSRISAKLREGYDRFDAFAACFPAGTVSGAPKVRAVEVIRKHESEPRGLYAGAVGYFDYRGNMDTCIAIRTIVLENGIATVQAGAGIVADSVPELEYQETIDKAKGMFRAIELAEGGAR